MISFLVAEKKYLLGPAFLLLFVEIMPVIEIDNSFQQIAHVVPYKTMQHQEFID